MRTGFPRKGLARSSVLGLVAALLLAVGAVDRSEAASEAPSASVSVIVRESAPLSSHAERAVRRFGGTVTRQLPIVGGFAARLSATYVDALEAEEAIAGVWRDRRVAMYDEDDEDDIRSYDALPPNEVWRQAIGIPEVAPEIDGDGVAVAVLDSGIVPSPDLADSVAARADLTPDRDGSDRYGHGTHMAGIVAGDGAASAGRWRGVAPGAKIVAVKVAGWDGATDVSAVLAGLQWVVTHKDRYGIRVLNLSFGTDSYQSYLHDPLDFAVERVWQAGILVVVAAGNRGSGDGTISKPGDDPFVLTVGAADLKGTVDGADDVVAGFSSRGPTQDNLSKPDLVAPGVTIVSSRAANSTIDAFRPLARVDDHYFKGTGSSQAAAVVSGIAALMFEADPSLTPDVAKAALVRTTNRALVGQKGAGGGLVDAADAVRAAAAGTFRGTPANSGVVPSNGLGSIHDSRGSYRVWTDWDNDGRPEKVDNERDVFGAPWDPVRFASTPWTLQSWLGLIWAPLFGEAPGFDPMPPGAHSWSGMAMESEVWGTKYWSESIWEAKYWSGKYWSSSSWN